MIGCSCRLARLSAAALVLVAGLVAVPAAQAQKKGGGGTGCTLPPADPRFALAHEFNPGGYPASFGLSTMLAPARFIHDGVEYEFLIAAAGTNRDAGEMHFFVLDPATHQTVAQVIRQIPPTVDGTTAGSNKYDIGNVNGDGIPDVLVGDSGPSSAALFVSSLEPDGTIDWTPVQIPRGAGTTQDKGLAHFGWAVALGDVTGDGLDEMIVTKVPTGTGKQTQPGEVFVYRYDAGVVTLLDRISQGQVTPSLGHGDFFGTSVAVANVAGLPESRGDLIVGAHQRAVNGVSGAGAVFVFEGGTAGFTRAAHVLTSTPLVKGSGFGYRVAAGDIDGDGRADVVGTTTWDTNTHGRVFAGPVITGTAGTLRFEPLSGYGTGWATNKPVVGDVTGDGRADIVIGAPNAANSGSCNSPGMTYLFAGVGTMNGLTTAWSRHTLPPPVVTSDYMAFGWSTALADGYPFLAVHQRAQDQVFLYRVFPD